MTSPPLAKLMDWFANMSRQLERMDNNLREVLDAQGELRELMAHLQSDLRVVKTAVAHNSDSIQQREAAVDAERPSIRG